MDPACDFCGVKRAVVYCRSDVARLCLSCDESIHSANALSRRHLRSLICNGCGSEAAIVRCLEDKVSLCESCDGTSCVGRDAPHRRQPVTCYSECPSLSDLSRLWSSLIDPEDLKQADSSLSPGPGMVAANGSFTGDSFMQMEKGSSVRLSNLDSLHIASNVNLMAYGGDQLVPDPSKAGYAPLKDTGQFHDGVDDFDLSFNIDDIDCNFGKYDLFGCAKTEPIYHSEDARMDCLFMDNSFSVNDSSSSNVREASFLVSHDGLGLQSSHVPGAVGAIQAAAGGAGRVLFNPYAERNFSLSFPLIQVQSNKSLSVSDHTGESSATDYQDCEVSPRFLTEVPWDSKIEAPSPQARDKAKMRYNEKKKTRIFGKQVRYAARKARADSRKRVKGRFVKASEEYDCNPKSQLQHPTLPCPL